MPAANLSRHLAWVGGLAMMVPLIGQCQTIHCDVLRTSDSAYAGRCLTNSTAMALLVLRPSKPHVTGRWHGTGARVFGTVGDSTKDMVDWQAFSPVFVDVNAKDSLFSYCWCLVTRAVVDTEGLHFDADRRREGRATNRDFETLRLARSYFTDASRWNRRDERSRGISYCPRKAASRTLFCALYHATVVAQGEGYLATPANAAVRDAIEGAVPKNKYNHPLTDFNNDPQVDFGTMTRMLDDAMRRVRQALAARRLTNAEPRKNKP